MVKTLYLTDLDGTLLTPQAQLSPVTRQILQTLPLPLTCATARTAATVSVILKGLPWHYPVILMNGALIYDLHTRRYLHRCTLSTDSLVRLFSAFDASGVSGFVYTVQENEMICYYERLATAQQKQFYEERVAMGKVFKQVASFQTLLNAPVVYVTTSGPHEQLLPLYEAIRLNVPDVHASFYRDVYNRDSWFLEIAQAGATKAQAARILMAEGGFEELVCFGDNHNDLPMFELSDRCYAVANAPAEVRARATAVIGSNLEDGVARFLQAEAARPKG